MGGRAEGALNRPLETAHCDRCQADIDVPHEFWKDILSDIHEEVKGELKEGDGRQSTIFGTFNVTLTYYHVPPHCTKCNTAFEVDEGLTQPYTHTCAECGRKVEVLPAPEWLVKEYPPAKILIDAPAVGGVEGAEKGEGKEMEKSAVSTPIAFTCPQCGGALMVDGKDRLEWFRAQAEVGLLGGIDEEKTGEGVIVCKDGFRATTVRPEDFLNITS